MYEKSYTVDIAAAIDTEQEIVADDFGVSLETAQRIINYANDISRRLEAGMLASVIGMLLQSKNMVVMIHSLAIAFNLNELNGVKSQSEIAKKLGVTRALISHYVIAWRDLLSCQAYNVDNTTFRKSNDTREIYKKTAQSLTIQAKYKHD